jgi:hypothetical protein
MVEAHLPVHLARHDVEHQAGVVRALVRQAAAGQYTDHALEVFRQQRPAESEDAWPPGYMDFADTPTFRVRNRED